MKEKVRKEYVRRVRAILKTEVKTKNRITAINTVAVPVVSYSFSIINWNPGEITKLDRKTRKLLMSNKKHHPKADVCRLHLPKSSVGQGMNVSVSTCPQKYANTTK